MRIIHQCDVFQELDDLNREVMVVMESAEPDARDISDKVKRYESILNRLKTVKDIGRRTESVLSVIGSVLGLLGFVLLIPGLLVSSFTIIPLFVSIFAACAALLPIAAVSFIRNNRNRSTDKTVSQFFKLYQDVQQRAEKDTKWQPLADEMAGVEHRMRLINVNSLNIDLKTIRYVAYQTAENIHREIVKVLPHFRHTRVGNDDADTFERHYRSALGADRDDNIVFVHTDLLSDLSKIAGWGEMGEEPPQFLRDMYPEVSEDQWLNTSKAYDIVVDELDPVLAEINRRKRMGGGSTRQEKAMYGVNDTGEYLFRINDHVSLFIDLLGTNYIAINFNYMIHGKTIQ